MKALKSKLLLLALVAITCSTLAYGTLAYFTAEDTAHNIITTGDIKIDLLEWIDADRQTPFPEGGVHDVMPGSAQGKLVEVKNLGTGDAYIRIAVDKAITLAEGAQGQVNTDLLLLDIDTDHWTYKDGYYYYHEPLAAGKTTAPLFTTVTFSSGMDNLYQGATASVTLRAYAVQIANNGATVFDAAGWPETPNA